MGPLVAPAGTAVRRRLGAAAVTVAGVPLKATAFWPAVALKPLPRSDGRCDGAPVGADERDRDWVRETRGIDPIDFQKLATKFIRVRRNVALLVDGRNEAIKSS